MTVWLVTISDAFSNYVHGKAVYRTKEEAEEVAREIYRGRESVQVEPLILGESYQDRKDRESKRRNLEMTLCEDVRKMVKERFEETFYGS